MCLEPAVGGEGELGCAERKTAKEHSIQKKTDKVTLRYPVIYFSTSWQHVDQSVSTYLPVSLSNDGSTHFDTPPSSRYINPVADVICWTRSDSLEQVKKAQWMH